MHDSRIYSRARAEMGYRTSKHTLDSRSPSPDDRLHKLRRSQRPRRSTRLAKIKVKIEERTEALVSLGLVARTKRVTSGKCAADAHQDFEDDGDSDEASDLPFVPETPPHITAGYSSTNENDESSAEMEDAIIKVQSQAESPSMFPKAKSSLAGLKLAVRSIPFPSTNCKSDDEDSASLLSLDDMSDEYQEKSAFVNVENADVRMADLRNQVEKAKAELADVLVQLRASQECSTKLQEALNESNAKCKLLKELLKKTL